MNFDFSATANVREAGKRLEAGIRKATFKGVEFKVTTSQQSGDSYKTMALNLEIEDYGPYTQNFFEPQDAERKEGTYGLQPSALDHFLITAREIMDAVNPEIGKDLDSGKLKLSGTFKQVVDKIKSLTDPFIGSEVEIKLIPGSKGYVNMPGFPARITKTGDLGIATRIIGHNLTLTSSEQRKIDAAATAAPTNMSAVKVDNPLSLDEDDNKSTLDAMKADVNNDESLDDLPF